MKILVIDGNSLVSRAFYGMSSNLATTDGQPTGAIYGFFTMLEKVRKNLPTEGICVTFDMKGPLFRHEIFPEYKAGRKPMPEDLVTQLPLLRDVLEAMNVPQYREQSWEADDLMGTIARLNGEGNHETILVTGDRDCLQLITESTSVYLITTKKTTLYTPEVFEGEYGFAPKHLVDLKAIMGDVSDNIPGIKGLGEKTVTPLIQEWKSIDAIYEKLQDPEEKLGLKPAGLKKLREGEDMARLCYDLATIRTNAPLEGYTPEKNVNTDPKFQELQELLTKLELFKLIQLFGLKDMRLTPEEVLGDYSVEIFRDEEACEKALENWKGKELAVLALPDLSGVSVFCKEREACGIFLSQNLECYEATLKALLTGEFQLEVYGSKVFQYDLLQEGISVENIAFDVELAAYLLAPDDKDYSLETLCKRYLKLELPSTETFRGEDVFSPLGDHGEAIKIWGQYTVALEMLSAVLRGKLIELQLEQVMYEIELPLCGILAQMQQEGISMDRKLLATYGEKLQARVEELETLIQEEAGENFNVSSPHQLGVILFEKMELPTGKKTKTGYSTDVEVLEELRGNFPEKKILSYIIEHRHVAKLHSTYAKGLEKVITSEGKIHSTFKNTVTATGRLSSTEPNLQNIPIRTPLGAELRDMFVAKEGNVLIDADYSQIELRLLANLSQDEGMISAFLSEEDFHTQTASQVFHKPVEEVDATLRRAAKAVNFGIIYGMSAYSLAGDIGVTVYEAKEYIDRYFNTYPKVKIFMEEVVENTKEVGFVSTLYGRKRWVPDVKSSNVPRRKAGERVAQNMPMQGTAADIMKLAMIAVAGVLKDYPEAHLVLQIHDEIIVECPASQGEELRLKVVQAMEDVAKLKVPLLVEGNLGKSWGDSH